MKQARVGFGLLLMAALLTKPAAAHEDAVSTKPTTAPDVSLEARSALDRLQGYLNGLDQFEIIMEGSRDEVLPFGYKLQNNETATMVVQRPNKFRIDVDGDIKKRSYYYDGTTLTMVSHDDGVYARTAAPGTIREVVSGLLNAGVEMPLIDVLHQGFEGSLLEGVRYGLRVGETTLDGTPTDHLAFRQSTIDWQIWLARNGQPRKLLITTRYEVGDPQYQITMKWKHKPLISPRTFHFVPPAGIREIPFDVRTVTRVGKMEGSP